MGGSVSVLTLGFLQLKLAMARKFAPPANTIDLDFQCASHERPTSPGGDLLRAPHNTSRRFRANARSNLEVVKQVNICPSRIRHPLDAKIRDTSARSAHRLIFPLSKLSRSGREGRERKVHLLVWLSRVWCRANLFSNVNKDYPRISSPARSK